jgi:hypothetical protein
MDNTFGPQAAEELVKNLIKHVRFFVVICALPVQSDSSRLHRRNWNS